MNIRSYAASDLAAIAELFTAAVHVGAAHHYDDAQRAAWAPVPPDLDYWRGRLATLNTLLAEQDARLIGFIAYEDDGHIDLLFTSPSAARQGVASALYERAESALRARGVRELFTEASLVARPFFIRHGFDLIEEEIVVVRGIELARFRMRKTL